MPMVGGRRVANSPIPSSRLLVRVSLRTGMQQRRIASSVSSPSDTVERIADSQAALSSPPFVSTGDGSPYKRPTWCRVVSGRGRRRQNIYRKLVEVAVVASRVHRPLQCGLNFSCSSSLTSTLCLLGTLLALSASGLFSYVDFVTERRATVVVRSGAATQPTRHRDSGEGKGGLWSICCKIKADVRTNNAQSGLVLFSPECQVMNATVCLSERKVRLSEAWLLRRYGGVCSAKIMTLSHLAHGYRSRNTTSS